MFKKTTQNVFSQWKVLNISLSNQWIRTNPISLFHEIFPADVCHDACGQSVPHYIYHRSESVPAKETKRSRIRNAATMQQKWSRYAQPDEFLENISKKKHDLQCPVHCNDEGDVISGQPNRCQHNYHGDQSSLWYPCCSDACCSRCDAGRDLED